MKTQPALPLLARLIASTAASALAISAALAAPMKIEAVVTPKADSRLDLADGSKRYLLAAQREGKASGTGPLAGATMLEWGIHDVDPANGANAQGYLVFTASDGETAYLRYQFRGVPVPGPDGKPRFLANGFWETVGGTGKFKGLRGAGLVRFNPRERQWVLEGELVSPE